MANYSVWALGASQISISGGGRLDGVTQGDGSHLIGRTLTLNSFAFEELRISDGGSDISFDDNDGNQRLVDAQSFDGVSYSRNTVVEAEYRITLRDPTSGMEYEALGFNFRTSSPAYGTVEGLSFVDVIPPAGVALEIIGAFEGPGSSGQPPVPNEDIAVPACFTPGTMIRTPDGPRRVETLQAGDWVSTHDGAPQRLIWVGHSLLTATDLARMPHARPVLIAKDTFGAGLPNRDMRVSPLHRILLSGPEVELYYGEPEVLAAAGHLIDGDRIRIDTTVPYAHYLHLQCQSHEILISDGLPSESYNPGAQSLHSFSDPLRQRLISALSANLPRSGLALQAARPIITRHEAAIWQSAARVFFLASDHKLC